LLSHLLCGLGLSGSGERFSQENQIQIIKALYQFSDDTTFGLAGYQASAKELYYKIGKKSLFDRLLVYFDDQHEVFDDLRRYPGSLMYHRSHLSHEPQPDVLLFYMPQQVELKYMRLFQLHLAGSACFLFPFLPKRASPLEIIENPHPLLLYFFPCAGTGRLSPPLTSLLQHFQFLQRECHPLSANIRLNQTFSSDNLPDFDLIADYFVNQIKTLDYYQYMTTHDPFDIRALDALPFLRKIALIRDPRDVVTSYYMREFVPQFGGRVLSASEKEQALFELMQIGFVNRKPNYFLRWPNLTTLANFFVNITESANTLVVKFEDLHHAEAETYQRILQWLGFDWHPLITLSPEQLAYYCHRGSIAHQTEGGVRSDNPEKPVIKQGVLTNCRKGETGDWKNHFTPALTAYCQAQIGAQLKVLGYS
jgi:hypothetical protein